MRKLYECKRCGHAWAARKNKYRVNDHPLMCPKCQSKKYWFTDASELEMLQETETRSTIFIEDVTNQGGQEWHFCMYFDDISDVPEVCAEPGYNVATIEVPLGTVDVTWRGINTRPAAHPSERGCYTTMPLVLCKQHLYTMLERIISTNKKEVAS